MSAGANRQHSGRIEVERGRLRQGSSLQSFHWVVVFGSLLVTILAWHYSKTQLENKARARFMREANKLLELVSDRMHKYEDSLWGGAGMCRSLQRWPDRHEWLRFSTTLQLEIRYPGANGIGLIQQVDRSELDPCLATLREQWPDFEVKRADHTQPEHLLITCIEPLADNYAAQGLDVAHELHRYRGALRSRDSGLASMTGPIVLVQGNRMGFLLYVPLYQGPAPRTLEERRQTFVGMVYAPVMIERLMLGVLSNSQREVGFRIRDQETLLYDELQPGSEDFDSDPLFQTSKDLPLYGRTWRFEISSSQSFREAGKSSQPRTILIAGLCLDFLLLAMFWLLSRSNRRAIEFAELATQDLYEEQARLQAATEGLRVTNEELESFIHVASHDLKSPLRAIDNLSQWISEDLESMGLDPETAENLELLRSRVARMETLLDGLLQFSRVGRKNFAFQPVNKETVADLLSLGNVPADFEISLDWEIPEFETAKAPFEIVLRNLVSNAIKHDDRTEGEIRVSATLEEPGWVVVRVEDDGPGIPPEFRERVFGMFQTLKPRDELEAGGVGLALVKKAADRYGGSIELIAAEGRGTTFVVKWPRALNQEMGDHE